MFRAGISLRNMRVCEPFGPEQRKGLWLYHVLEPETWAECVPGSQEQPVERCMQMKVVLILRFANVYQSLTIIPGAAMRCFY